jgi:hypothetical protein
MIKSFCEASNLRGMIRGGISSKYFERCEEIFQECFEKDHRGSVNDICSMLSDVDENEDISGTRDWDSRKLKALEDEMRDALLMSTKVESCYKTGKALM